MLMVETGDDRNLLRPLMMGSRSATSIYYTTAVSATVIVGHTHYCVDIVMLWCRHEHTSQFNVCSKISRGSPLDAK